MYMYGVYSARFTIKRIKLNVGILAIPILGGGFKYVGF